MELKWFSEYESGLSMQQVAELIEDYVSDVSLLEIYSKYSIGPDLLSFYIQEFYIGTASNKNKDLTITII